MIIEFHTAPIKQETPVVVESCLNRVEMEIITDSSYDVMLVQKFQSKLVSFTRHMFWFSPLDRELIRLEGARLGVHVVRERDLHRVARLYHGPQRMVLWQHQGQQPLVVMAKIKPQVRRILRDFGGKQPYYLMSRASAASE